MTSRRTFLTSLTALSGQLFLGPPRSGGVPTVRAISTVFFGRPDGTRNLVRFQITGLDAPAGRLRVYSRRQRLIGTAGILSRGDVLEGELWLPIERATDVISVLEAPGVRRPLRTIHQLAPQKKWTIYLFSIVDAEDIDRALGALPPLQRRIQAAIYTKAGITINPLPRQREGLDDDHLSFLRMAARARELERDFGVPVSHIAFNDGQSQIKPTVITALAGSSVGVVTNASLDDGLANRWLAPDNSLLLSIGGIAATPAEMSLTGSGSNMTSAIERMLAGAFASPTYNHDIAVVVNGTLANQPADLITAVANWNSRFVFPRIVLHGATELSERLSDQNLPVRNASFTYPSSGDAVSINGNDSAAAKRLDAVAERTDAMVDALAAQLAGGEAGLEAIAREIETVVAGTLVFNPSPFARSELVKLSDRSTRVATHVPALGYAFFPDRATTDPAPDWQPTSEFTELRGETMRLRIDENSGAIASMQLIDDPGRQWVQRASAGLNGVRGSRLEQRAVQRIPGVATRFIAHRRSMQHGAFTSTMTLYDELPWIDIENDVSASGTQTIEYLFSVARQAPHLTWEIPAGVRTMDAPASHIKHLRWIRLADPTSGGPAFLLRGLDTPYAAVDETGELTSYASTGLSRYRIALTSQRGHADAAWRFGWNAEPLRTVRVARKLAGALPRFGSIISTGHPGTAVLGIKVADNGDGIIVYVQELLGEARHVSVRAGLVRFGAAHVVDYLEQNVGDVLPIENDQTTLELQPNGISAVRLSQVTLAGG